MLLNLVCLFFKTKAEKLGVLTCMTGLWEPFRGTEIMLKLNGTEACCGALRPSVSSFSRAPANRPETMCLIVISSIVLIFSSLSVYERGLMESTKLLELMIKHHFWPIAYCKKCPECAVVTGAGRRHQLPLHLIHVQRPFQIVGVDIMDLILWTSLYREWQQTRSCLARYVY